MGRREIGGIAIIVFGLILGILIKKITIGIILGIIIGLFFMSAINKK